MKIEINNSQEAPIKIERLEKLALKFAKKKKKEIILKQGIDKLDELELSVAFVKPEEIREMNRRYRNIDKATDVLSFEGKGNFWGEIIICYEEVNKEAEEKGRKIEKELDFIFVHALLHLLGLNDETEEELRIMNKETEKFL